MKRRSKIILGSVGGATLLFCVLFFPLYFTIGQDSNAEGIDDPVWFTERIDCAPEYSGPDLITAEDCKARGCDFQYVNDEEIRCSFTDDFGYNVVSQSRSNGVQLESRKNGSIYTDSKLYENLEATSFMVNAKSARVLIKPPDSENRWQVPFDHPVPQENVENAEISVKYSTKPFGITVTDEVGGHKIFDSSIGPLIFEELYMQINTGVPSYFNIYGLGEKDAYPEYFNDNDDFGWKSDRDDRNRITIWSAGQPVKAAANLYGHQTFLLGVSGSRSYGIWLLNSNAMEVEINRPNSDTVLSYRPIGGVFDFYFFVDETPSGVIKQYHSLVGKPFLPPYWAYGFQLSRWGYADLDEVKDVVRRNMDHDIPFETQYVDIDYMERALDFTLAENFALLPNFTRDTLHANNMKLLLIFDPAICRDAFEDAPYRAYTDGVAQNVFIKNHDGKILHGRVWPTKAGLDSNGEPYPPKSCDVAYPGQGCKLKALFRIYGKITTYEVILCNF